MVLQGLPSHRLVVLRGLDGAEDRLGAPGNHGLEHFRGDTEGGGQLRCLDHPETAAGTSSHEEDPAPFLDRPDEGFHGGNDDLELPCYRLRHLPVLFVDYPEYLLDGLPVYADGRRVPVLRGPLHGDPSASAP